MEDFARLMRRLLEIQSGGRPRTPELIAEDERLMDALRRRTLARKPPQSADLSPNTLKRMRFEA